MSLEQRQIALDVFKIAMWVSISICSFLLVNTYHEVREDIKDIHDKIENIEARTIRIEYELKLK